MSEIHVNRSNVCGYCELPGHAAADCPDRRRVPVSSELDKARAALKHFGLLPGFVGELERFEAAVRANERSGETRAAELLGLATVLEIPRASSSIPLQLRLSFGYTDRWAICDREGHRWHRKHGWVYEPQGIRDEASRDATRYTLAEALPIARQLAAEVQP